MHAVGHTVHVVCPDKKAGQLIKTSLHDFEGDQTYTEKPGHLYGLNKTFSEVDPAEYDAVYVAGGRGPEYIRIDPRVQRLVRHFHEADKPIFTICHGVQVLIAVDGVVKGKRVAALQYCEPEVRLAGGTYVDVEPTGACVDGKLVSAKGWPGLAAFIRELPRGPGHGDRPPLSALPGAPATARLQGREGATRRAFAASGRRLIGRLDGCPISE